MTWMAGGYRSGPAPFCTFGWVIPKETALALDNMYVTGLLTTLGGYVCPASNGSTLDPVLVDSAMEMSDGDRER